MFSLKSITLDSIIDCAYQQNEKLTVKKLIELADPQTSIYDLAELLCAYINGMTVMARKTDLGSVCKMEIELTELAAQLKTVRSKYDKAVMDLVETKKKEIELEKKCLNLETDNQVLKSRLEQRTSQLRACGYKID
jgi:hypothetical protein